MKYDVRKLPEGVVLKFDDYKYIMMHKSKKSPGGQVFKNGPIDLTYVVEFNDDMEVDKVIAGRVVDKQEPYDINKEFMLVEWDSEEVYNYNITMPLKELTVDELRFYSAALSRYDNKKRNK